MSKSHEQIATAIFLRGPAESRPEMPPWKLSDIIQPALCVPSPDEEPLFKSFFKGIAGRDLQLPPEFLTAGELREMGALLPESVTDGTRCWLQTDGMAPEDHRPPLVSVEVSFGRTIWVER